MNMSVIIAVVLLLLIGASGASFYAGMRVDTWKNGASTASTLQASIDQFSKTQTAQTTQFNQLSSKIDALNLAAQSSALATQDKIHVQDQSLSLIAQQLRKTNVGNCSVTAAFDQLLEQSYETVYPSPASGSDSSAPSGSQHGTGPAATGTTQAVVGHAGPSGAGKTH
jgi:hypothetical protein